MDMNILLLIGTGIGVILALPSTILSVILLRDRWTLLQDSKKWQ